MDSLLGGECYTARSGRPHAETLRKRLSQAETDAVAAAASPLLEAFHSDPARAGRAEMFRARNISLPAITHAISPKSRRQRRLIAVEAVNHNTGRNTAPLILERYEY